MRRGSRAVATPDLKTKLYDFPVNNDPEPYLTAGTPARLQVAEPAALDNILLCLKFIEAGGEQVSAKIVARCWDLIAERDKTFYARSDPWAGLAPDDARRPFFPRAGADRTPSAMASFLEWAKAYAASLPATVAALPSSAITYGTRVVPTLAEGSMPRSESFAKFLSENHLQQDQLVSANDPLSGGGETMPILYVVPNRRSLYALTVPKEALDRHPGRGPQSVSTFRLGSARIIRNESGQNVLAIDLTPLSIKTSIGDDTLASRTYDDIPRLDGLAFVTTSPQVALAETERKEAAATAATKAKQEAADNVRKAALAAFEGEPSGLDVLGIRLGTSYADAEALIRKHMQVGWVLTNADPGKSDQITSMRIFVAPDQSEYIALFDSPKHAPERVIGVRRYLKLTKAVSDDEITTMLTEKYGPPVSTNVTVWEWGAPGKPPCQVLGENPAALVVSEGAPMDRSALLQTPTSTIRVAFLDGDFGKFDACRPQIHVDRGRYTNGDGLLRIGLFDVRIYATLLRPDGLTSPAETAVRIPF